MMILCQQPPHDGDDDVDGNVGVGDVRLSFYSKYDDDGRLHQKKCHRHNNLAVTVNDAAPCTTEVQFS